MPVVQPYAISEAFSTAGKVNMNYRMAPFTYIKRATAMHAVLKSERLLSIPTTAGLTYKSDIINRGWRNPIDAKLTLLQWEDRFDDGDFFQTPSEVCECFWFQKIKAFREVPALRSKLLCEGFGETISLPETMSSNVPTQIYTRG